VAIRNRSSVAHVRETGTVDPPLDRGPRGCMNIPAGPDAGVENRSEGGARAAGLVRLIATPGLAPDAPDEGSGPAPVEAGLALVACMGDAEGVRDRRNRPQGPSLGPRPARRGCAPPWRAAADRARRVDPQLARVYWVQMVSEGPPGRAVWSPPT
jgi:hypothetical protein